MRVVNSEGWVYLCFYFRPAFQVFGFLKRSTLYTHPRYLRPSLFTNLCIYEPFLLRLRDIFQWFSPNFRHFKTVFCPFVGKCRFDSVKKSSISMYLKYFNKQWLKNHPFNLFQVIWPLIEAICVFTNSLFTRTYHEKPDRINRK